MCLSVHQTRKTRRENCKIESLEPTGLNSFQKKTDKVRDIERKWAEQNRSKRVVIALGTVNKGKREKSKDGKKRNVDKQRGSEQIRDLYRIARWRYPICYGLTKSGQTQENYKWAYQWMPVPKSGVDGIDPSDRIDGVKSEGYWPEVQDQVCVQVSG